MDADAALWNHGGGGGGNALTLGLMLLGYGAVLGVATARLLAYRREGRARGAASFCRSLVRDGEAWASSSFRQARRWFALQQEYWQSAEARGLLAQESLFEDTSQSIYTLMNFGPLRSSSVSAHGALHTDGAYGADDADDAEETQEAEAAADSDSDFYMV